MSAAFGGGRYVCTGEEHAGGMAKVYICRDTNLDRLVAIKFLSIQVDKRRLYDEIGALQKIRSGNVVEIYDIVIEPPANAVGIVQEYLPGEDLQNLYCASSEEILRVAYQIANGLASIHAAGLIHRDIKPNNVKTGDEKLLKIFDFNLTRVASLNAETLGFHGTPGYAAPELYRGGNVSFTQAIDVYALAATIVYVAEHALPKEAYASPVMGSPSFAPWVAQGGFQRHLPEQLSGLLHLALSSNPYDRPSASMIHDMAARLLLRGRHRALLTYGNQIMTLSATRRKAVLAHPDKVTGKLVVEYDDLGFIVRDAEGEVTANNQQLLPGTRLPISCVISLGGLHRPYNERYHITFDQSHPEVLL